MDLHKINELELPKEYCEFNVQVNIIITKISKPVPIDEISDFDSWLRHTAIRYCGEGSHTEHYAYTENALDDIEVEFTVNYKILKKKLK